MLPSRRKKRRRGLSVVLVLGLLSITLALGYAMLRSQATSVAIQHNLSRRSEAKQAARTGLMVAIREMHQASWPGVDTVLNKTLGGGMSFSAAYTTGDPELTDSDPDYHLYPYRVTITSTGYAADPTNPTAPSSHIMQAVVQLVPRALSSQPASWPGVQDYTVISWANSPTVCELPCRIEGKVRLHGELQLCESYPPESRPFDGVIDEVALFNRALVDAELAAIYSAGMAGDGSLPTQINSFVPKHYWRLNEASGATTAVNSAGTGDGTYELGASPGATGLPIGVANNAAEFDGRDDHINVGNIDIAGTGITMCGWFKANTFNNSDARIISKAVGTNTQDHDWMLSTTNVSGNMRLRMRIRAGGTTTTFKATSGNLVSDTWYFAAATFDGLKMRLYLNGMLVGETDKVGTLAVNPLVPVYIGDNPPGSPLARYLQDLEAMRLAGLGDHRPFNDTIELPYASSTDSTLVLLEEQLGLTTANISPSTSTPISHPGAVSTYQLYPGGKVYKVDVLTSYQQTTDLEPDVEDNPLGVFRRDGVLQVTDSVQIEGTLITTGISSDLQLIGDNTGLKAVDLLPLHGETDTIQLPAAIISNDVHVHDKQGVSIAGFLMVYDDFAFEAGTKDASCDFVGRLLTSELQMFGRTEWSAVTSSSWETWLTTFVNNLTGSLPILYFPEWLETLQGLPAAPQLTIREPSDVKYHWQDFSQPVYEAHVDDAGLVWDVVRWIDE